MFKDIDDTVEIDGFTLTAELIPDDSAGAPWDGEDGHGPVTGWERRDKLPGELILNDDRNAKRFYNFAEACKIARRDGWNAKPYDVPGETPRQRAAKAARADYERLRAWCSDQWSYVAVVVTASCEGVKLGSASLWGIESDAGEYLVEVANELIDEALDDARAMVSRIAPA